MSKKKSWVLFAITFALFFFGVRYYLDQSRQARLEKDLIAGFAQAGQALNAELPLRIDENTVLVGARADGMQFFYDYTVNDVEDMGDRDALIDVFRPLVAADVCNRINMVSAMGYGARYVYSYRFEDGEQIGSFSFTKGDCSTFSLP